MAKILGPGMSLDARGSLGPLIFSRNKSGPFVKTFIDQRDCQTPEETEKRRLVFARAIESWNNETAVIIDLWKQFSGNFPTSDCFGRAVNLGARTWYLKFNMNRFLYDLPQFFYPPLSPTCDYHPTLSISWTASGASLVWSPAIPDNNRIIVRQKRNLNASQSSPRKGDISHIFTESDSSPQLVTPACGVTGGPGSQPAFNCGSYIHFHIQSCDDLGRTSPILFFPLYVG